MMSLRDHESEGARGSSIRKLNLITEKLSNDANLDISKCVYCGKNVKASQYESHRCRGKRIRDLVGRDKAMSIIAAERHARQQRK
jgi:hypothetical protein